MSDPHDKPALRQHYRARRDAILDAQRDPRSAEIARLLLSIERMQHAGSVFVYVSTGSELGTQHLIDSLLEQGKTVLVPRILAEQGIMQPMQIRSQSDLAPGRFGIREPTSNEPFHTTPDLTLVPGLAFTPTGHRLGQGGGYYDRYLAQHPATYKVGLCFNEQLADALPCEEHDVLMDEVIAG